MAYSQDQGASLGGDGGACRAAANPSPSGALGDGISAGRMAPLVRCARTDAGATGRSAASSISNAGHRPRRPFGF